MKTNNTIAALAIIIAAPLHAETKTISWGNSLLGATATGTMSFYIPPSGASRNFYNTGRVDGSLLYMKKTLASGAANFSIAQGSQASNANGYLKVGSKTLASWNHNFTGAGAFSTEPLLGIERGGTYTVFPGISVGATASVNVSAYGLAVASPSGGFQAKAGLNADVAVSGNGTINIIVASGGLAGKASLCQAGISASADMKPSTDPLKLYTSVVNYSVDMRTRSPHGYIEAWYKRIKGSRHSWKIVNFTGTTNIFNIASGSFELTKSPILR
jgi:hypothetical protein